MGAHRGLRDGDGGQELLARNEYLAAENRIMKAQLKGRLKLSDAERGALGEIGHRLGRKVRRDRPGGGAPPAGVVIGSTGRQPKMTVLVTMHGNAFVSRSRQPS